MHCYCECFVDRLVRIVWNLNPIAEVKQYCNMYSHGKGKLFKIYQSIGPIIDRPKRRPRRDTILNQQQLLALTCRYQLVSLDRCGASDADKSIILYATNIYGKPTVILPSTGRRAKIMFTRREIELQAWLQLIEITKMWVAKDPVTGNLKIKLMNTHHEHEY